jgi:DNA methyltransferase 1-associated protein 1
MEDLKARYYEVAAKMMAVQKPAQYMTRPEFELYETMQNFNPDQERKRKEFALNTMARSKDEAREEESLLLEIKRILARTERFNEERRELYNRLDYPATDSDINSFKSSAGLQALLQNLMTTDKSKKRKSILGPGDGVSPGGAPPGSAVSESGPHHRRESIAAAVSSSRRDSDARGPAASAEPTPTTATSTTSASAHKKKGSTTTAVLERRKLSAHEEQVYGVTYHDRLGSGPTFRYERINKLYSHKSGQQQLRMTNALAELDVPPRLVMPTAAVTAQFEVLWSSVAALVDMRKMSDKLEGEIKLEEAKKMERERARMVLGDGEEG